MTSIQLYLGIKIHGGTRQFQTVLFDRASGNLGGANMLFTTNGMVSVDIPTLLSFTLPARLLFFGVPMNLIPATATPDLVVPLECIRIAIQRHLKQNCYRLRVNPIENPKLKEICRQVGFESETTSNQSASVGRKIFGEPGFERPVPVASGRFH